jgi:hypothetical protein
MIKNTKANCEKLKTKGFAWIAAWPYHSKRGVSFRNVCKVFAGRGAEHAILLGSGRNMFFSRAEARTFVRSYNFAALKRKKVQLSSATKKVNMLLARHKR